jgi:RHS repeat-associated protein
MRRGGQTYFYLADAQGNVALLTDARGQVVARYTRDPFGKLLWPPPALANPFIFVGREYDAALGLYYNRARYLNTSSGRFLTVDPYLGNLDDPLSLHRYIYARLDPVNRQDPSGRQFTAAEVSVSISVDETLETLEGAYYKNLIKFTVSAARCIYCLINPGYKLQGEAIDLLFNSDTAADAQEA